MRRDFNQPFQELPTVEVSFIALLDSGKFVLQRHRFSSLVNEFGLLRTEVSKKRITSELVHFLCGHGLAATRLRELRHEQNIEFSFADDTPGSIQHIKVHLAEVELMWEDSNLSYVGRQELRRCVSGSPFVDDIERSALDAVLAESQRDLLA